MYSINCVLRRSLSIKYTEDREYGGIPLYRFQATPDLFAYPPTNNDNHCFCVGSCPEAGGWQVSWSNGPQSTNSLLDTGGTSAGPCKVGVRQPGVYPAGSL